MTVTLKELEKTMENILNKTMEEDIREVEKTFQNEFPSRYVFREHLSESLKIYTATRCNTNNSYDNYGLSFTFFKGKLRVITTNSKLKSTLSYEDESMLMMGDDSLSKESIIDKNNLNSLFYTVGRFGNSPEVMAVEVAEEKKVTTSQEDLEELKKRIKERGIIFHEKERGKYYCPECGIVDAPDLFQRIEKCPKCERKRIKGESPKIFSLGLANTPFGERLFFEKTSMIPFLEEGILKFRKERASLCFADEKNISSSDWGYRYPKPGDITPKKSAIKKLLKGSSFEDETEEIAFYYGEQASFFIRNRMGRKDPIFQKISHFIFEMEDSDEVIDEFINDDYFIESHLSETINPKSSKPWINLGLTKESYDAVKDFAVKDKVEIGKQVDLFPTQEKEAVKLFNLAYYALETSDFSNVFKKEQLLRETFPEMGYGFSISKSFLEIINKLSLMPKEVLAYKERIQKEEFLFEDFFPVWVGILVYILCLEDYDTDPFTSNLKLQRDKGRYLYRKKRNLETN